jgi:hypothetical protein
MHAAMASHFKGIRPARRLWCDICARVGGVEVFRFAAEPTVGVEYCDIQQSMSGSDGLLRRWSYTSWMVDYLGSSSSSEISRVGVLLRHSIDHLPTGLPGLRKDFGAVPLNPGFYQTKTQTMYLQQHRSRTDEIVDESRRARAWN